MDRWLQSRRPYVATQLFALRIGRYLLTKPMERSERNDATLRSANPLDAIWTSGKGNAARLTVRRGCACVLDPFLCSEASCHSCGCKSRQQESSYCCSHIQRREGGPTRRKPGCKSFRWLGKARSDPCRGASNLTGCSKVRTTEASKFKARVKRIAGSRERRAAENSAKANVDIAALELIDVRAPRGRRGRHVRTECAAKARNRSRVA